MKVKRTHFDNGQSNEGERKLRVVPIFIDRGAPALKSDLHDLKNGAGGHPGKLNGIKSLVHCHQRALRN
jgi:hypothetical protein